MGRALHGSATTTHALRTAMQRSQASIAELSRTYGLDRKTVAKWRKRSSVADARRGPRERRSSVLSREEEALVVAFRRHRLPPLDDCLYALQPTMPHLTRSGLPRCFRRHEVSRLPEVGGGKPRKAFKACPIGCFYIDIAEVRAEGGKLCRLVAIDRTSKSAFAELHERAGRRAAADFLRRLAAAAPCRIHAVPTDNGTHSPTRPATDGPLPTSAGRWPPKSPFPAAPSNSPARRPTSILG